MRLLFLCIALGFAISRPGAAAEAPAAHEPAVTISDAWVRWLPSNLPAGGYFTLRNIGTRPQVLTGATSPDFSQVSLHRSLQRGGVSVMEPVERIEIAAGASLRLAAGGYHLMLEQATRPVQPGDRVAITLHFSDGSSRAALFEVRKPDAADAPH